ncbi:paraquat-inducible protein A [Pseudoruegeria sp. SHC-113]|uniref:paraquat-inducible protein A n=1 Tax=Pseudoruegeria sp. SHC-113 TaxID=2855439 RepID=UPI0021BA4CC3|nr:paraquat-inducible protein A [Pseudoruegeria sp. SHC-113]MCT8161405.1 paraquat-inducible protein A [Pseudoruegeria sp. SHC-113]
METAEPARRGLTARQAGLVGCVRCGTVHEPGTRACRTCGARLHSRDRMSLQHVWAWWFAGLCAYIPANMLPMLRTDLLGTSIDSTIIGGVVEFIAHGDYFVGIVVLLASVAIPVGKFIAVAYLALSVQFGLKIRKHRRHVLYEAVEFIGRWSMVDVFVVALTAALVQLGFVITIVPGPGAVCFAVSVAFTMIAAQSFDTRSIWDRLEGQEEQ